ncbi:MAG TPA: threonine ammonia-lyase IlvA [Bacteroidales bacterium]
MSLQDTPHTFNFEAAAERLKPAVLNTPLQLNASLSAKYKCKVYLKREDLQVVRSYKIRGAYNMISQLSLKRKNKGVVCASAGNHAQGFAWSCKSLGIKGIIFMPSPTPRQKVNQVKMFGGEWIELIMTGDTFDDCLKEALEYTSANGMTFIPPFDDYRIIEGQGTVALEIFKELERPDFIFVPVGGGGLIAGVLEVVKSKNPCTKIIGVEPEGAPSMVAALKNGKPVTLDIIDKFVDGAAVKRVGTYTFELAKDRIYKMLLAPEGLVCSTILKLYNEDAIVVEPAGALSVAALEIYKDHLKGKTVVCIVSGSNNDISRMQEIMERSLLYEGLKHYFLVRFPQRAGALRHFVNNVLGPNDDITRFEFIKKNNREAGPALVGIEQKVSSDYAVLLSNMKKHKVAFTEVNNHESLFEYLI